MTQHTILIMTIMTHNNSTPTLGLQNYHHRFQDFYTFYPHYDLGIAVDPIYPDQSNQSK